MISEIQCFQDINGHAEKKGGAPQATKMGTQIIGQFQCRAAEMRPWLPFSIACGDSRELPFDRAALRPNRRRDREMTVTRLRC